jgi:dimethylaniline monooxygenase (N-oxide forming)
MQRVAVIGAGPGGIVAARYLKSEGLDPVIFEQGAHLGGQWSGDPGHSGVWPSMRTNTSRIMTSFSDLPHHDASPTYPTNTAMGEYLERYAHHFHLLPHIRFNTLVRELSQASDGTWLVRTDAGTEIFDQAIVATGRYNKPALPKVPGLDTFSGSGGLSHAFAYKHPEALRGSRVLVAGCSISALEIASDLAMLGANRVVVTNRKQRYVLPKLIAGVPTDHVAFTRFAALAEESFPMAAVGEGLKGFILAAAGNPAQFGAPRPSENIFEANISQSQFFLPLVAEGRIAIRPWIESVDRQTVHFADGTSEDFDAIICGTGYDLNLPFLSAEILHELNADEHHLDLYKFTFPERLPGLAFLGMLGVVGPYFPVLELQARWIAYTFSGAQPAPSAGDLQAGVAAYRARRGGPQELPCHAAALLFARAAGVEPNLEQWPELGRGLMFGPLTPTSFRLNGRDSLPDAPARFAEEIRAFGCIGSDQLTPMQAGQLQALAGARDDASFARFVARVPAS